LQPESHGVPLDYYARQGIMTDPLENSDLLRELPDDIPTLCQIVQGILIHIFWAHRSCGLELSEERKREVRIRKVARKLTSIMELDGRPLTASRSPEKRLVGNCRDFSVMLCAILRNKGIAARARCGFGTYFTPGRFEDHWICEYWKADERRWAMVDAQLDDDQRKVLRIGFDPFDVPVDRFLIAGRPGNCAVQAAPTRITSASPICAACGSSEATS